jgi:hypothetical protein
LIFVLKEDQVPYRYWKMPDISCYTWKCGWLWYYWDYIRKYYAILNINRIEFDSWTATTSSIWLLMGITFWFFAIQWASIRIHKVFEKWRMENKHDGNPWWNGCWVVWW